ncbi:hypothetical protein QBC46DRAFT_355151 [Diplogelasinospora grovesii]|uniref:Ecp2 effector protein-like domain-containing protein n=1 Tax=Diplogelasinospora grovesii TaxID=303347 RepID=A0AAN6S484_9PEZI|nr:hypothetical protein QBC46DRAFT_355151 [Diplogelasinospora grovesii]
MVWFLIALALWSFFCISSAHPFSDAIAGRNSDVDLGHRDITLGGTTLYWTNMATNQSYCTLEPIDPIDFTELDILSNDCQQISNSSKQNPGFWTATDWARGANAPWVVLNQYRTCRLSVMRLNGADAAEIGNLDVAQWIDQALLDFSDPTWILPTISTTNCLLDSFPNLVWKLTHPLEPS